jgi:hypothetical protein
MSSPKPQVWQGRWARRTTQQQWSMDDVRLLRELFSSGHRLAEVAQLMGRTESAIRNKAFLHSIRITSA